MGRTRIARAASCVLLLCAATVDSECLLTELWIDSVNLAGISGCFAETVYFGLHATTVWTLGGVDIAPSGTTGIIAEMPDGASSTNDPIWSIGTVMPNATNTWSDGYQVGLWVEVPVCAGTSPFWETSDPSEETQWSCDSNNDGTLTVGEGNGFVVTCGCPDENGVVPTLTPTLSPVPNTQDPMVPVVAPTEAPDSMPISIPSTLEPTSPTSSSPEQVLTGTPSPLSDETSSQACNLTLASDSIPTVDGCYFETTSANSRGRWMKPGGLVSIQWENADSSGYWAVVLAGVGGVDEYICTNDEDIDDPTALDVDEWICEDDLPKDERGSIDELKCNTELCENSQGTSNDGLSAASTTAIVAGSVIGGFMLAGLILVGLFVIKRRRGEKAKEIEPATEKDSPVDPDAPPEPIPVFEPWGTRPPPKCYG